MNAQFFGQFLIERGELDEIDLRRALEWMDGENQTLGELAAGMGFASEAECNRVGAEQRTRDLPWGELAMHMGVINSVELEELLELQQETRVGVATALRRLELLPEDRVEALQDAFKAQLPQDDGAVPRLPGGLLGNRVAEILLGWVPRLCSRTARLQVKLGETGWLEALPDGVHVASIEIIGTQGLKVTMIAEPEIAKRLAFGIAGVVDAELLEELSLDAIGEFLNLLGGNTIAELEAAGLSHRLEAPHFGVLPTNGVRVPIASEHGGAELVLEPLPPITSASEG